MQDKSAEEIFGLFFDGSPVSVNTVYSGRGESDFREALIVETHEGKKYVIKLADNDFTDPERIADWQRTAEEYLNLGYYCPRILCDKNGSFPRVDYKGRSCTAYAEEYSKYRSAEEIYSEKGCGGCSHYESYAEDMWIMTARIAAEHFDYTDRPSAYCLFDVFCPSDKTDEVLENANAWSEYAGTLPGEFSEQTRRIRRIWDENRQELEKVYRTLPGSVFQADLNPTNILLDEEEKFAGVYDFNLSGKDVFLNYLMRENFGEFEEELDMIRKALKTVSGHYRFTDAEKDNALRLYRCLKPLWYCKLETLRKLGSDREAVKKYLDKTEYYLTADIDLRSFME